MHSACIDEVANFTATLAPQPPRMALEGRWRVSHQICPIDQTPVTPLDLSVQGTSALALAAHSETIGHVCYNDRWVV